MDDFVTIDRNGNVQMQNVSVDQFGSAQINRDLSCIDVSVRINYWKTLKVQFINCPDEKEKNTLKEIREKIADSILEYYLMGPH